MSYEATKDREIKRDTRTGIFYYKGTPIRGGKERKLSLGVRTFGSAVLAKKDLLLRLRGIAPGAKDILFRDYAKIFLEERKKKAPATFEQAYFCIQELMPFFETYTMRQVTERAWDEYKEYQAELKPGRNLRYDKRHLLMMLHRLKAKGIVSEIPELEYADKGSKRKRVLTANEISAIFKHAEGTVYGLALFMYLMGPRPGEVLGSKWTEFDLKNGIWNIPADRTKTRTARSIKLHAKVLEWLKERARTVISDFVFPGKDSRGLAPVDRYNKQWDRMLIQARLSSDITPYYLRHTFLSECAKKVRDGKLSLVLITKYAGTSIEQFEKTYLHIEGEDTKSVAELMELD
jgi:integrase